MIILLVLLTVLSLIGSIVGTYFWVTYESSSQGSKRKADIFYYIALSSVIVFILCIFVLEIVVLS